MIRRREPQEAERRDARHSNADKGKDNMAAKKKAPAAKKAGKASGGELIISKSRTKAAAKKCNVGSEFYGALDKAVRAMIAVGRGAAPSATSARR